MKLQNCHRHSNALLHHNLLMNSKGTKHSGHCFHSEDVSLQVRWEHSQVLPVRHRVHLTCIVKTILNSALMLPPP